MRDAQAQAHPLDADDYDWPKAFEVAGPPEPDAYGADNDPDLRHADPQDTTTPLTPFQRSDVAEVIAFSNGENDMADWLCLGRLNDGRWFLLRAGCDYTGWDCQSGGSVDVAADRATLLRLSPTDEERKRLGLPA